MTWSGIYNAFNFCIATFCMNIHLDLISSASGYDIMTDFS